MLHDDDAHMHIKCGARLCQLRWAVNIWRTGEAAGIEWTFYARVLIP